MIELHITASGSWAIVSYARIVRLAEHGQSEAAVHHVIPGIQFGHRISIATGEEICEAMGYVYNCFLRTAAIHGRDLIIWQIGGIDPHATPTMRVTGYRPLFFRPFQNGQIPRRPI